jgi:RNA polymerase sigma factor (sigma-70 family)
VLTEEQNLADRARRGDQEAFTQLDRLYRSKLTGYCGRFLIQEADREEAVQRTLLRAWQGLDRFDGRSSFATWLYKIATNVCLDLLKESKKLPRDSLDDTENTFLTAQASPEPPPEQLAIWRQMRDAIWRKGRAAKPPWDDVDGIIYRFHCEKEESFRTIAEQRLRMEESAVKQRYYRKIEPVLKQVAKEFGESDI